MIKSLLEGVLRCWGISPSASLCRVTSPKTEVYCYKFNIYLHVRAVAAVTQEE